MDFYQINAKTDKNGETTIWPSFTVARSKDLMVRGKAFYAIWDEAKGLWSTDEYDVARLVDEDLRKYSEEHGPTSYNRVKWLSSYSSRSWNDFKSYLKNVSDSSQTLDNRITFSNTEVKRNDYVSKRVPYALERGPHPAWDELIGCLYNSEERAKIEWAIGSIIAGDSRSIQKFIVFYGEAGSGKSTILNIIERLFEGYITNFEAKALTSSSNAFATEVFKDNPLVAIQHDGDLSKIEDNSKLNSIISHEMMTMNEKYKASYSTRTNCFLFMATNRPVKITDAKSGIIRRLIDVRPSGETIPTKRYHQLMDLVNFELGAIAAHCQDVYFSMGKNYYSNYRPFDMILQTDVFFNFVENSYHIFKEQDGTTVTQAYEMYKTYCDETSVEFRLPLYKFREELKSYFKRFSSIARVGPEQKQARSVYYGFLADKFSPMMPAPVEHPDTIVLDSDVSIFDRDCEDCPAQYASVKETPLKKWEQVTTTLKDIDTSKLHYVKPPENHIVMDFDLKDEKGEKSLERNLEEAGKRPPTYSETSKGGGGLHLHYVYDGDPTKLSSVIDEGIELKVFTGKSSLRRKLTKCNNVPIAHISSGLPLKGEKVVNFEAVKSERGLRSLIERNLRKEIHPGTKPSIDFIFKILEDAYNSGLKFDVTDLRPSILAFANNSTNQSEYCVGFVSKMTFKSDEPSEPGSYIYEDETLVFFDVEVFPNLFIVVWKRQGEENKKVYMINPSSEEMEHLLKMRLVGFNNRRYDNHILYGRYIGYDNSQLYKLSQRIISGSKNAMFGEAYNISYTDIYDFSSKKQSLKKWEIELNIHHMELGLPWDQPVPKEQWEEVAEYCGNDVDATEATFNHLKGDWTARQILADLTGMSVNSTTQQLMAKLVFGDDPKPQDKFIYTDLSETFPGYTFDHGKSDYRGEDPKEGGYVYAEPGVWGNVALLDIESMHPTSAVVMNVFGPYTQRFDEILQARLAIKHGDIPKAKSMMKGQLSKYLDDPSQIKDLAYALKIAINIVYGLTSAKFDNKFRDPRNKDNIVAKRGALFMIDLKHAVQEQGFTVAHIKTDSIKIPDATPEIIEFVKEFGKQYGYTFDHEATYDKFYLANDAVYLARYKTDAGCGDWTATGTQFIQPYLFKTLCTKVPIEFKDLCEAKSVTSALYLNMNEDDPEKDNLRFIGKIGLFCPIKPGCGGGLLLREKDGKYYSATGAKGYRWLEAVMVKSLDKENDIDRSYFDRMVDQAKTDINSYADVEWFLSDDPYSKENNGILPF